MGYITPAGLKELKNYKYNSSGYSIVDKIMNKLWWEQIIKIMPMVKSLLNSSLIPFLEYCSQFDNPNWASFNHFWFKVLGPYSF